MHPPARISPILVLLAVLPAAAEDWPQFRGPTGQGQSSEENLPVEWSETKNIRWKTAIPGRGWSSPAILGNLIWLTTAVDESLRVLAVDRASGKMVRDVEVFRIEKAAPMHAKNSHASPTPVLEGDRVYVHFGAHGTAALSSAGEILWKTRLPYNHLHGTGGSPALYGDALILSCDGTDVQYVVSLDRHTGRIRWKSPRTGAMAYSTPLVISTPAGSQVVSPGGLRAVAYDPDSGREIWSVRYGDGFSNIPRPLFAHGLVYITTGFYQPALMAIRPDGKGDVTSTHVAWSEARAIPLTPSPIVVGGEVYTVSDNGIASCLDARTGKLHWRERIGGNHSASPVHAAGRIYFLDEDGQTTILRAGAKFEKLAVNRLPGPAFASLAASEGALYLRTAGHLYRMEGLLR